MAKTIEQILGYVYLTGLVEAVKTGIPDVLPPEFASITKDTLADQGRYTRVTGTRRTSRQVHYGAPSLNTGLRDIGSFDVKLIHSYENIMLDVKTYQSLRNYDDYNVQNMGIQEVNRQAFQQRARIDNLQKAAIYSMLANGAIYFDGDGNLLPSSSGAVITVDYNVPANNKNQLNGIIGASWATVTTDIVTDLLQIKEQSVQLTGYQVQLAFYGQNLPAYFAANTSYVQPFLARSPNMREKFLDTGEVPDGLFGFKWMPVHLSFFEDQDGTVREFFGGDAVTFTPAIDMTWYELMLGTYPVPTSFNPFNTLQASMGSFNIQRGIFSYSVPVSDPMTAKLFYGHTFLPVLKNPDIIFIADTTP